MKGRVVQRKVATWHLADWLAVDTGDFPGLTRRRQEDHGAVFEQSDNFCRRMTT